MKRANKATTTLNCPSNSLGKMSVPSTSDTVSSLSLSKKSVPAGGGNRPKGFGDKL